MSAVKPVFADVSWDKPLTMAEVAEIIGWTHDRTSRVLHRVNGELRGLLLRNIGGQGRNARWTTTKRRLRLAFPEWFGHASDSDERIEVLEEEIAFLKKHQKMSASAIGGIVRRLDRSKVA